MRVGSVHVVMLQVEANEGRCTMPLAALIHGYSRGNLMYATCHIFNTYQGVITVLDALTTPIKHISRGDYCIGCVDYSCYYHPCPCDDIWGASTGFVPITEWKMLLRRLIFIRKCSLIDAATQQLLTRSEEPYIGLPARLLLYKTFSFSSCRPIKTLRPIYLPFPL